MTAIALLNSEKEPYVVADTLLSADGADPHIEKTVWLPALGDTNSEWGDDEDKWHIARLARKTFSVPISSGLLAFSGQCKEMFEFWSEISEKFHHLQNYNKTSSITKELIEQILINSRTSSYFSLLGIVKNNAGSFEPFKHNKYEEIITTNYGKCYVSGSGAGLLKQLILSRDLFITKNSKWLNDLPISATEELAEYISSEMLYQESDIHNGFATESAIAHYCGGFYEWYSVQLEGTKVLQPRLDIHIKLESDYLTITRLYCSEQRISATGSQDCYTKKYPLLISSFSNSFIDIPYSSILACGISLSIDKAYGALIDSTFDGYEDNPQFQPRKSHVIEGQVADELFGLPMDLKRVRLIINDGKTVSNKAFIGVDIKASLQYTDGEFVININNEIKEYILSQVSSLG